MGTSNGLRRITLQRRSGFFWHEIKALTLCIWLNICCIIHNGASSSEHEGKTKEETMAERRRDKRVRDPPGWRPGLSRARWRSHRAALSSGSSDSSWTAASSHNPPKCCASTALSSGGGSTASGNGVAGRPRRRRWRRAVPWSWGKVAYQGKTLPFTFIHVPVFSVCASEWETYRQSCVNHPPHL